MYLCAALDMHSKLARFFARRLRRRPHLVGCRVGEASHPGPAKARRGAAATPKQLAKMLSDLESVWTRAVQFAPYSTGDVLAVQERLRADLPALVAQLRLVAPDERAPVTCVRCGLAFGTGADAAAHKELETALQGHVVGEHLLGSLRQEKLAERSTLLTKLTEQGPALRRELLEKDLAAVSAEAVKRHLEAAGITGGGEIGSQNDTKQALQILGGTIGAADRADAMCRLLLAVVTPREAGDVRGFEAVRAVVLVDDGRAVSDVCATGKLEDTLLGQRLRELPVYADLDLDGQRHLWYSVAFAVVAVAARCSARLVRSALSFGQGEGGRVRLSTVVGRVVAGESVAGSARGLLAALLTQATRSSLTDEPEDDGEPAEPAEPGPARPDGSPPAKAPRFGRSPERAGPALAAAALAAVPPPPTFGIEESRRERRQAGILLELFVEAIFWGTRGWGGLNSDPPRGLLVSKRAIQIGLDALWSAGPNQAAHDDGGEDQENDPPGYIFATDALVALVVARYLLLAGKVTESARACRYIFSSVVQKSCPFWLLTFWLLILYLRVFLTFFSGFVHFGVDFMVFWSLEPALRALRGQRDRQRDRALVQPAQHVRKSHQHRRLAERGREHRPLRSRLRHHHAGDGAHHARRQAGPLPAAAAPAWGAGEEGGRNVGRLQVPRASASPQPRRVPRAPPPPQHLRADVRVRPGRRRLARRIKRHAPRAECRV